MTCPAPTPAREPPDRSSAPPAGRRILGPRRICRRHRGQVLVLFALGMVAMLGFAAIAVDGAMAYWQRGRAQNAVDAATTAAVAELAGRWDGSSFCRGGPCASTTSVQAAAERLARDNGFDTSGLLSIEYLGANQRPISPQPNGPIPPAVRGVKVSLGARYSTSFGRAVGVPTLDVAAQAAALFGTPSSTTVFPLAIGGDSAPLPNDVTFTFKPPQGAGNCSSTCVNYEMLATLPAYPAPPPPLTVRVGDSYTSVGPPEEDGRTVSTSLRNYVSGMIAADTTGSTCSHYVAPNPRIALVPYVDPGFNEPPESLTVRGFRAFMFTAAYSDRLEGCWVNVNAATGTLDPHGPYTGVTLFTLIPPP